MPSKPPPPPSEDDDPSGSVRGPDNLEWIWNDRPGRGTDDDPRGGEGDGKKKKKGKKAVPKK